MFKRTQFLKREFSEAIVETSRLQCRLRSPRTPIGVTEDVVVARLVNSIVKESTYFIIERTMG